MAYETNNIETINPNKENVVEKLGEMTQGRGVDACIDAEGMEADRNFLDKVKAVIIIEKGTDDVLNTCFISVRRGGTVSVVGIYGSPYDNFPLHRIFDKGLTIKMGQAPVHTYIDHLTYLLEEDKVKLDDILTHTLPLSEAAHGMTSSKRRKRIV